MPIDIPKIRLNLIERNIKRKDVGVCIPAHPTYWPWNCPYARISNQLAHAGGIIQEYGNTLFEKKGVCRAS